MIARLSGNIIAKTPPEIILLVGDIAYEILCPLSSFNFFDNNKITLHTHLSIREDAHTLFGFITINEKKMFRSLIKVNGVGPKVALAILSYFSIDNLSNCINNNDDIALAKTPGIGKKTAQKIIIELRNKITQFDSNIKSANTANIINAKSALFSLGFKDKEVDKMLYGISIELTASEIIHKALKNK